MMQTSRPSSSDSDLSSAFERLHPQIQRWIYDKQWTELREVQAKAFNSVLSSDSDIVLAAATASGKTEAAFLPILSLIADAPLPSFQVMYVGPLRALINDQFYRLDLLCEQLGVPVVKWHGEVQGSMKRQARERPAGVLLITPESLEAILDRKPEIIRRMFEALKFIVIDELHTFLATERGLQLASLLKRLDVRLGHSTRRIGLSATIGDLAVATEWIRPEDPESVIVIEDSKSTSDLRLQIRGITVPFGTPSTSSKHNEVVKNILQAKEAALRQIGDHLFETMRSKGNHLIFSTSRREVELLADMLREASDNLGVSNEFFPHHGNLSREVREIVEHRLKLGGEPTTAVATATLELGVDIGSVESVAQVGAPRSISALRQRVGRSGRRKDKPAILRLYVREPAITEKSTLIERLRLETAQAIAAVRLMLDKWVEPPIALKQNLSTLLHQILALVVEYGGISYEKLIQILGGPGPFSHVSPVTIRALLRGMAKTEPPLLEQAPDGTIMLGAQGERLTESYEFFAVFKSPDEFRISAGGRELGTVSIINSFGPGDYIVFAGQRWKVLAVDDRSRKIQVEGAPAGRAPMFEGGEPSPLHDRFVEEVRAVFLDSDIPQYLDSNATLLLAEGRSAFHESSLGEHCIVIEGGSIHLFPWRGTTTLDALRLAIKRAGITTDQSAISLKVSSEKSGQLAEVLNELANAQSINGSELAELDENLERSKYDYLIPRGLLRESVARDRLNTAAIPVVARELYDDLLRHTRT
jgi:ATP-dependent Lhr-like helicase